MKELLLISTIHLFVAMNLLSGQRILEGQSPCTKGNPYFEIGDSVKIWDAGGVYPDINKSKSLIWPSKKVKRKSGENSWKDYTPKSGEVGQIIHVFDYDESRTNSSKYIYLLQIGKQHVPIGCGYITDIDKMTSDEEWEYHFIQDSIRNSIYANGCLFKLSYGLGNRYQGGSFKIDSLAESYACDLLEQGIDTILMMKSFNNNHGLGKSNMQMIAWRDNASDYIKFFSCLTNGEINNHPYKEIATEKINYFFNTKIATNNSSPESIIRVSHPNVYNVYFVYGDKIYTEYLTYREIKNDTEHVKTRWWTKLLNEINSP